MMNMKAIILITCLVAVFADDLSYYYCPSADWRISNLTQTVRCYKKLPAIYRADLTSECSKVGGVPINIDTYQMGTEVINMIRNFTYYGIWVDAMNFGTGYQWIDGRDTPYPLKWCSGIGKTFDSIVLVCPYPHYSTFSMYTCCLADRTDATKWVAMCTTEAKTDCQYVDSRKVKSDATKYKLVGSSVISGGTFGNEECCRLCTKNPKCAVFDYDRNTATCYFFQKFVSIIDLLQAVDSSTNNWIAGALYARLA